MNLAPRPCNCISAKELVADWQLGNSRPWLSLATNLEHTYRSVKAAALRRTMQTSCVVSCDLSVDAERR